MEIAMYFVADILPNHNRNMCGKICAVPQQRTIQLCRLAFTIWQLDKFLFDINANHLTLCGDGDGGGR